MADAPATRFSYVVKRLEAAVRAELDSVCRERDLTTTQYVALSVLRGHPGMSSAQLAARSFVSPQSANQLVGALERSGLIVRTASASNRRILEIALTERGAAALASCDAAVDEVEDRMLGGLSAESVEEGRATMLRCIANLRSSSRRAPGREAPAADDAP
ncbi:MAG: MarR family transcriptional regulator [Actinomycetota bacterium]|nr:MarR family transcriptional regulator [Actinomycetota bacterium]